MINREYEIYTTLLEKYPIFFFFKNLMDLNEANLLEVTFNLHTHA